MIRIRDGEHDQVEPADLEIPFSEREGGCGVEGNRKSASRSYPDDGNEQGPHDMLVGEHIQIVLHGKLIRPEENGAGVQISVEGIDYYIVEGIEDEQ